MTWLLCGGDAQSAIFHRQAVSAQAAADFYQQPCLRPAEHQNKPGPGPAIRMLTWNHLSTRNVRASGAISYCKPPAPGASLVQSVVSRSAIRLIAP